MAGRFMRKITVVVPMFCLVLMMAQLVGCSPVSNKSMVKMLENGDEIEITVPMPKEDYIAGTNTSETQAPATQAPTQTPQPVAAAPMVADNTSITSKDFASKMDTYQNLRAQSALYLGEEMGTDINFTEAFKNATVRSFAKGNCKEDLGILMLGVFFDADSSCYIEQFLVAYYDLLGINGEAEAKMSATITVGEFNRLFQEVKGSSATGGKYEGTGSISALEALDLMLREYFPDKAPASSEATDSDDVLATALSSDATSLSGYYKDVLGAAEQLGLYPIQTESSPQFDDNLTRHEAVRLFIQAHLILNGDKPTLSQPGLVMEAPSKPNSSSSSSSNSSSSSSSSSSASKPSTGNNNSSNSNTKVTTGVASNGFKYVARQGATASANPDDYATFDDYLNNAPDFLPEVTSGYLMLKHKYYPTGVSYDYTLLDWSRVPDNLKFAGGSPGSILFGPLSLEDEIREYGLPDCNLDSLESNHVTYFQPCDYSTADYRGMTSQCDWEMVAHEVKHYAKTPFGGVKKSMRRPIYISWGTASGGFLTRAISDVTWYEYFTQSQIESIRKLFNTYGCYTAKFEEADTFEEFIAGAQADGMSPYAFQNQVNIAKAKGETPLLRLVRSSGGFFNNNSTADAGRWNYNTWRADRYQGNLNAGLGYSRFISIDRNKFPEIPPADFVYFPEYMEGGGSFIQSNDVSVHTGPDWR